MKHTRFNAAFTQDAKTLDCTCTIKVQGIKVTGEGGMYHEALESCFARIRDRFGKAFWRILEDGELHKGQVTQ